MADRCRLFALSDCKDPAFYDDCKHSHDDCCDRCELLASTMDDEIDNTLVKNESNLSDDDCEEMRFLVKEAKSSNSIVEGTYFTLNPPRFSKD